MRISDVMTRDPVWCTPNCTTAQAALLMRDCHCGTLPVVVSSTNLKVLGIVTDRDLCLEVVATGRSPGEVLVGQCMTPDPVCCYRTDEIRRVLLLMGMHRVRRLIVVDHSGQLQGVVSLTDLIEYEVVSPAEAAYVLTQIDAPGAHRHRTAAAG